MFSSTLASTAILTVLSAALHANAVPIQQATNGFSLSCPSVSLFSQEKLQVGCKNRQDEVTFSTPQYASCVNFNGNGLECGSNGNFLAKCTAEGLEGVTLQGNCTTSSGVVKKFLLNLDTCFQNIDGELSCIA